MSDADALLVLPRLRVQNANALSSPHTWGFPAISAFIGLMQSLERRLTAEGCNILFDGVGVICHTHEPQMSRNGFTQQCNLTRNPLTQDGGTPALVEEGRTHLDITLVFHVRPPEDLNDTDEAAKRVGELIHGIRIAGGTVIPNKRVARYRTTPTWASLGDDPDQRAATFKAQSRRWLPGFALVGRDDLLHEHHAERQGIHPDSDLIDTWLDLAGLNMEPEHIGQDAKTKSAWHPRGPSGWIVPIPVGYGALTPATQGGDVPGARDSSTPVCFVESLFSVGEWKSPHHLTGINQLVWYVANDLEQGCYRLRNDYAPHYPALTT